MTNGTPRSQASEEAVSPVIGVILMVAITVVLAAIVFILVTKLTGQQAQQAPQLGVESLDQGEGFRILQAGTSLSWSDFTASPCITVPTGPVHAGDELHGCAGSVRLVYVPTNTLVYAYP